MKYPHLSRRYMILAVVATLLVSTVVFYQSAIYRATDEARVVAQSGEVYASYTYYEPASDLKAQIAFYPGGLVESDAYAPLAHQLTLQGFGVYILDLPLLLAIFQTDAAKQLLGQLIDTVPFYVSGHSLGGVAASTFASHYVNNVDGVILLAAYPIDDLSTQSIPVLSIRAEFDEVLNLADYNEALPYLPTDTFYYVIEGGNHGQFGDYGPQTGDGIATIRPDQQWLETAQVIADWHNSLEE